MYGYIYKITYNVDGRVYIGQKKATKLVEHYWGSGRHINKKRKRLNVGF